VIGRRGFTILETIFAALLLGITGMALLNILPTSVLAEKRAQNRMQADSVALSMLEDARVQPFNAVLDREKAVADNEGTEFKAHQTVSTDPANAYLKRVRIVVQWEEAGWSHGARVREVTLEGLIVRLNR